ncbi:MAG: hypothetical protein MUO23_11060 [Anaerolineales bacterium]|nr:hypothetical protein [Anaerolineales bacterium]
MDETRSSFLLLLRDRIDLDRIPFTERGSRLMVLRNGEGFAIRLAERWLKRELELAAYRVRPSMVEGLQLTDGGGQPLAVEITTFPHCITCRTRIGEFQFVFVDSETLLVSLPSAHCGVTFRAYLDQVQTDRRGGVLRLTGEIRRNLAYTTNAGVLRNETSDGGTGRQLIRLTVDASAGGRALLLNLTPRLGFNRWVPPIAGVLQAAERRWHEWFAAVPVVAEALRPQYYYAWWTMRAGLISSRYFVTREVMTPSKLHYVGSWQWDNFFHALAYRHVEPRLAQDQLRILLDHQRDDGMIPDAVHDEGIVTHLGYPVEADVTKPPLIAWAAWKLFQHDHDREFLDEIYEPLVRSNRWWFENNDVDQNGLCEYQHPYSSGLDDSPLWDEGMPVESPDLNTYLCLQQESLARIAEVLGESEDARVWAQRADDMANRMIKHLWDPAAGLFWARRDGKPIGVRTPFSLFPLITGRMPAEVTRRLAAHLTDEHGFWPRFPIPTVALNDPAFDAQTMWRGPTWINVNYLMIEGLRRSGLEDEARELRRRTLELVSRGPDLYEYYHPLTGERPPQAASTFGWTAALYIDLAIQASREEAGG